MVVIVTTVTIVMTAMAVTGSSRWILNGIWDSGHADGAEWLSLSLILIQSYAATIAKGWSEKLRRDWCCSVRMLLPMPML